MTSLAKLVIAFLALALVVNAQANSPAAWTASYKSKTRTVGAPRVSPDGKRIVYTVTTQ